MPKGELEKRIDAAYGTTVMEELSALAYDPDEQVRIGVAQNVNTTPDILTLLAADMDVTVCASVAGNSNTPGETLSRFVTHSLFNKHVIQNVIKNPNTPVHTLGLLADHNIFDIQHEANKALTLTMLEELSVHSNKTLREIVARHKKTSSEILSRLATDTEENVRETVLHNNNVSAESLAVLATEPNEIIRIKVACHPNTNVETLAALSKDSSSSVREDVAIHRTTSETTRNTLARDPSILVRINVALTSKTLKTLTILAVDTSERVRQGVLRNQNTPVELLWCLTNDDVGVVASQSCDRVEKLGFDMKNPASWADPQVTRNIYDRMTEEGIFNESLLIPLLETQVPLTQIELIELCELCGENIKHAVRLHYTITHPLLEKILKHQQSKNFDKIHQQF